MKATMYTYTYMFLAIRCSQMLTTIQPLFDLIPNLTAVNCKSGCRLTLSGKVPLTLYVLCLVSM